MVQSIHAVRRHAQHNPAFPLPAAPGRYLPERYAVEQRLLAMYPRLHRHDLYPWKLWHGPLIPDALVNGMHPRIRRIVEVNCGDGVLTNTLALLFPDIEFIGIDPDPSKIARARKTIGTRSNIRFACGNAATMTAIPCDRIIYNRCLGHYGDRRVTRTLMAKTLQWVHPDGDFIMQESPLTLAMNPHFLRQAWRGLKTARNIEPAVYGLIRELGYPNPMVYACRQLPGLASELYFIASRQLTLSGPKASVTGMPVAEWQDANVPTDESVLHFLFQQPQSDFTQVLQ